MNTNYYLTNLEKFNLTVPYLNTIHTWNNSSHTILGPLCARIVGSVILPFVSIANLTVHISLLTVKTATGIFVSPYNFFAIRYFPRYSLSSDLELTSALVHAIRIIQCIWEAAILPVLCLLNPDRAWKVSQYYSEKKLQINTPATVVQIKSLQLPSSPTIPLQKVSISNNTPLSLETPSSLPSLLLSAAKTFHTIEINDNASISSEMPSPPPPPPPPLPSFAKSSSIIAKKVPVISSMPTIGANGCNVANNNASPKKLNETKKSTSIYTIVAKQGELIGKKYSSPTDIENRIKTLKASTLASKSTTGKNTLKVTVTQQVTIFKTEMLIELQDKTKKRQSQTSFSFSNLEDLINNNKKQKQQAELAKIIESSDLLKKMRKRNESLHPKNDADENEIDEFA